MFKNCFFEASTGTTVKTPEARKTEPTRPAVPRLSLEIVKENPLSKRLRKLDNTSITHAPKYSEGVYITTNEERSDVIAELLAEKPNTGGGCHIGFSGWHNLDIMALRRSSYGVICDHNPENAYFLSVTLNNLLKSNNREQFIEKMTRFVNTHDFHRLSKKTESNLDNAIKFSPNFRSDARCSDPSDEIRDHLQVKTGWLANEERFQFIKFLAHNDKIVLLTEDILATETFIRLKKLLQENAVEIDTLYTSNIGAYMKSPESRVAFLETVQALSESETKIIDAR
ncbi:LIC_10091 family protein [Legionella sp. WA2024007413]